MLRLDLPHITHVVINTGYTSRILEHEPKEFDDWSRHDDDGEHYDLEDDMKEFLRKRGALYLFDNVWGDGLVPLSEDYEKVYETVTSSLPDTIGGHIVFKTGFINEAFQIVDQLVELHYCACFDTTNLYKIDYVVDDDRTLCVMVLSFDTESG